MTQTALAKLVKDQGQISAIVNNRQAMTADVAEAAATICKVTAGWLMFGEADTPAEIAAAEERGRRAGLLEAARLAEAAAMPLVLEKEAPELAGRGRKALKRESGARPRRRAK